MGRKFRDMETPEQAYARQSAPARAEAAQDRAIYHARQAEYSRQQTTTASYRSSDFRDAGIASIRKSKDADRHTRNADRHSKAAEAARAEARQAEADAKPKKRRGWFF